MLILTRRVGETVVVGDGVKVTVLGFKGNQVRLGIDAPSDVTVHRGEILSKIRDSFDLNEQEFMSTYDDLDDYKR